MNDPIPDWEGMQAEIERLRAENGELTAALERCRSGREDLFQKAARLSRDWQQAEARLAKVVAVADAAEQRYCRCTPHYVCWIHQAIGEIRAAAQPEESRRPLFEAGVTLDVAGKRLSVALGHIADGTVQAAAQPEEKP